MADRARSASRERRALVCDGCGARNYKTTRKKNTEPGERFAIKKYCKACDAHTVHRESK